MVAVLCLYVPEYYNCLLPDANKYNITNITINNKYINNNNNNNQKLKIKNNNKFICNDIVEGLLWPEEAAVAIKQYVAL